MPVDEKHPDYLDRIREWRMMRDAERGAQAIKDAGTSYLPKPDGFNAQSDGGAGMYDAYRDRAQFPEIVSPTLVGMVGVIHRIEPQITMPSSMEYLWESSTKDQLPLEALYRRVTAEILLQGRYGLLVDADVGGSEPYLSGYTAESLINWDDDLSMYVLDESGLVRRGDGFSWETRERYRVLMLEAGIYGVQIYEKNDVLQTIEPRRSGNRSMEEIPFVVMGARDVSVHPQQPPLLGVARAAIAMYRLDADYRHQLFMSGQETLFFTGVNADTKLPTYVGAGVRHGLPEGADVKYVGPECKTIEAHRKAIEDEERKAVAAGARMFELEPQQRTSGEALKVRYAAHMATLASVSLSSATGLERSLRHLAVMKGLNPNSVVVKPNLDFVSHRLTAQEVVNLVQSWQSQGISYRTLHENLQRGEIASPEITWEQELEEIKKNPPPVLDPSNTSGNTGQKDPKNGPTLQ